MKGFVQDIEDLTVKNEEFRILLSRMRSFAEYFTRQNTASSL